MQFHLRRLLTSIAVVSVLLLPEAQAAATDLPRAKALIQVPMTRQATDYTCGAAAVQSIIGYHGENIRESQLAKELKTNPKEGTNPNDIIAYARKRGYKVNLTQNCSLVQLKKMIDAGIPVLVLIQAWPERKVNYATDWEDGHYVVAIGYDDANVYFMDPCTLGNYTYIPTKEFLTRWHDTARGIKYNHFALTMTKQSVSKFDPNKLQKME